MDGITLWKILLLELEDGPYETLAGYIQARWASRFEGGNCLSPIRAGNINHSTQEDEADGADQASRTRSRVHRQPLLP